MMTTSQWIPCHLQDGWSILTIHWTTFGTDGEPNTSMNWEKRIPTQHERLHRRTIPALPSEMFSLFTTNVCLVVYRSSEGYKKQSRVAMDKSEVRRSRWWRETDSKIYCVAQFNCSSHSRCFIQTLQLPWPIQRYHQEIFRHLNQQRKMRKQKLYIPKKLENVLGVSLHSKPMIAERLLQDIWTFFIHA